MQLYEINFTDVKMMAQIVVIRCLARTTTLLMAQVTLQMKLGVAYLVVVRLLPLFLCHSNKVLREEYKVS
jgi:hypothetical protein